MNKLLSTEPDLVMIDVRTPAEFSEVHATRAKNLPLDTLRPKALFESGELRKDRPVYLICRTGGRALKAAEKLTVRGFDHGVVVEGGTEAGRRQGCRWNDPAPRRSVWSARSALWQGHLC